MPSAGAQQAGAGRRRSHRPRSLRSNARVLRSLNPTRGRGPEARARSEQLPLQTPLSEVRGRLSRKPASG